MFWGSLGTVTHFGEVTNSERPGELLCLDYVGRLHVEEDLDPCRGGTWHLDTSQIVEKICHEVCQRLCLHAHDTQGRHLSLHVAQLPLQAILQVSAAPHPHLWNICTTRA